MESDDDSVAAGKGRPLPNFVDVGGGSPPLEVRIERRDPGNVYWWTSAPPSDPELDAEPGEEK